MQKRIISASQILPPKPKPTQAEIRRRLAKEIKTARRWDIKGNWINWRSLRSYREATKINILNLIRKMLKKGQVSVLDIGSGQTIALSQIKKNLSRGKKDQVHLTGLTTVRIPAHKKAKQKGVDEIRIGRIETIKLDRQYDLIISVQGGIAYSSEKFKAIKKAIDALKPGG
ncbi:MAG: class I SAM-dependent methyltransferase, partial [Candidatus Diapherotrites archaeon]|nr:class I SAM-dependent methyltransferase [Candidatus Diapherotrites archaeon]